MPSLYNLARVRTATIGVGSVVLGAAVSGYLTFALSGVSDGDVVSYGIMDFDALGNPIASEVGRGTYHLLGPTLDRTTIEDSTNGGAAINLTGNGQVYITAIAQDFSHSVIAKIADYTLTVNDYTVNCTANSFNITLPTAVGFTGKVYNIKNSGTGVITIVTTSSQTIDGGASGSITLDQYDNLTVQSDGANWLVI